MKAMYHKHIIKAAVITLVYIAGVAAVSSCSYEELTPKTDDLSSSYVLPKGETPSAQEQADVKAIRNEYNNSIK